MPTPSKYQQAIFDWIKNGQGNAIILATAGSGKSWTIEHAVTDVIEDSGDAVVVAFNKHIADKLKASLAAAGSKATAVTTHSAGFVAVNAWARTNGFPKADVDPDKYSKLIRDLLKETKPFNELGKREFYDVQKAVMGLTNLARLTLVPPTDEGFDLIRKKQSLEIPIIQLPSLKSYSDKLFGYKGALEEEFAMADFAAMDDSGQHDEAGDYDRDDKIEFIDKKLIYEMARQAMMIGMRKAEKEAIIDFTDQLYLPVILELAMKQYGWIFSDESQDYSNVQRALILKMLKKGGRVIAVGDRNQAIMGFAGAATDSMDQFKRVLNAIELPLSICYRLPVKHIQMAKIYDPTIEARPNAPDGVITWETMETFSKIAKRGDLIMCRTTAPLVVACIRFIASGVGARVRGKKIGEGLISVIEKIAAQDKFEMKKFGAFMSTYIETQTRRLTRDEGNEEQVSILHDKAEAIHACYKRYGLTTEEPDLREFINSVDALFADDKDNPPIWLSSIHRAKGLEADNAILLNFQKMPHVWTGITEEQYQQEKNLTFVGLTRGKYRLTLVTEFKEEWDTELTDRLLEEAREWMKNEAAPSEMLIPTVPSVDTDHVSKVTETEPKDIDWATDPFWMSATVTSTPGESQTVIVQKKQEPTELFDLRGLTLDLPASPSKGKSDLEKQLTESIEKVGKPTTDHPVPKGWKPSSERPTALSEPDVDRTMTPTPPHLKKDFERYEQFLAEQNIVDVIAVPIENAKPENVDVAPIDNANLDKLKNMEFDFGDEE